VNYVQWQHGATLARRLAASPHMDAAFGPSPNAPSSGPRALAGVYPTMYQSYTPCSHHRKQERRPGSNFRCKAAAASNIRPSAAAVRIPVGTNPIPGNHPKRKPVLPMRYLLNRKAFGTWLQSNRRLWVLSPWPNLYPPSCIPSCPSICPILPRVTKEAAPTRPSMHSSSHGRSIN
jgi:hypothetical protein